MFASELILIFLGVFVTTSLLMKRRKRNEISVYRYPPCLPSLPVIGSLALLFFRDVTNVSVFFMTKAKQLGPIFSLRFGNSLVVTFNSRDALEKAFVKNASLFSDRAEVFMEAFANPENKGIIFRRKATEWKKPQQLSLSILKECGFGLKSIMETRIHREIDAMTNFIVSQKGESFDPKEVCILATSNVIMNILFGRRRDYNLGLSDLSLLMEQWTRGLDFIYDIVPLIRFLPSYRLKLKNFVKICDSVFESIKTETAECLQNTAEPCFVRSYIHKVGSEYDRAQLNYTLRDLFIAGTDTSSTILQWGLMILANNPGIQKRLHAEIDTVITGDRLPTLQDEPKLPYVEATILEITRWRTLVPLPLARMTSQSSIVDGYFISGGTTVIANLYAIHNDINVWKDPEVFRPERFLNSDNNLVGKENVIPFSIGRRSCLGEVLARAELFLIFTSLIKRFLILPPEGQEKINEDPSVPVLSLLYPRPFQIRLMERK